jgi:hypothetical protein
VQAVPRNARIDVEDVDHIVATIGPSVVRRIATKERTPVPRRESVTAYSSSQQGHL